MKIITSTMMKAAEEAANAKGIFFEEMMERAGRGVALRIIQESREKSRVLILCGKGNNAGDGLVAARYLHQHGFPVSVMLVLGQEFSPLAQQNFERLNPKKINILSGDAINEIANHLKKTDIVIDAVFGTGFHGELPEVCRTAFRYINAANVKKYSLDIPSGIDCDNGYLDNDTFIANKTYALAALKPAHLLKTSRSYCGVLDLISIGIPPKVLNSVGYISLLDASSAKEMLPKRLQDTNKGNYGKLLNIGGCYSMSGAMILSTRAALRCGAGLVKTAVPKNILSAVQSQILECTFLPLQDTKTGCIDPDGYSDIEKEFTYTSAVLFGGGMSKTEQTIALVEKIIKNCEIPMVIDGDGLNCLAGHTEWLLEAKAPIVLTPHMKEMSRITGIPVAELKEDRFTYAKDFALKYGVTLVLKDSNTVVVSPEGMMYMNANGNSGLAKAGSGDVLAGIIASFAAQNLPLLDAARLGVFLHGEAGDIAAKKLTEYSMLPSDVIQSLHKAIEELC